MLKTIKYTEEQLEIFLIDKLKQVYGFKKIIRQFEILSGRIDLLAYDGDGLYYVIEIKTGDITADAVCQVLRYTQYLNSEKSKNGKRRFRPLLIGFNIDVNCRHLDYLLKRFEKYPENEFYVLYTLYSVGISGVELGYYCVSNDKCIEKLYEKRYSKIDSQELEIEELEITKDCLCCQLGITNR
jgi:predicted RecB family endonuclease